MANSERTKEKMAGEKRVQTIDAVRHVGPTLESGGLFIPTGELPENRIENEGAEGGVSAQAASEDGYDREAQAAGAERLKTRLPGDESSDPHADAGAESTTGPERDESGRRERAA